MDPENAAEYERSSYRGDYTLMSIHPWHERYTSLVESST
jgi:hypothetical protein